MDNLKCNRLSCRSVLLETAVVTTCSHCFCVNCANELFSNTQVCPACETSLTEPDDVVICSLQPSNDYKTSVLSGLTPQLILEICGRAMAFWQYQNHQESCYQQAVLRSVNDRAAQLQKHVENIVLQANTEIGMLKEKISGLEREHEQEKRKSKDLQDQLRIKDGEYNKLKNQTDKMKRKALMVPGAMSSSIQDGHEVIAEDFASNQTSRTRNTALGLNNMGVSMEQVVGGMEANKIQRTPLRTVGNGFAAATTGSNWQVHPGGGGQNQRSNAAKSHRFQAQAAPSSNLASEFMRNRSGSNGSGNEMDTRNDIETMAGLNGLQQGGSRIIPGQNGLRASVQGNRVSGSIPGRYGNSPLGTGLDQKKSGTFRPAGFAR